MSLPVCSLPVPHSGSSRPALAPALVVVLLAAIFFRASNARLESVDTWNHWKYGEWIWRHGNLPEQEPFSPYSDPRALIVDTSWLSDVIGYLVYAHTGLEGIALLYALLEVARAALFLVAFRRTTGSLPWALLGVVLVQATTRTTMGGLRPQVFGDVCWAALLAACARPALSRAALFGIPLGVALWANLHGGFPLAFVLLGAVLAGRSVEQVRSRRSLTAALEVADIRRLALVLVLSVGAACVHPYGLGLLARMTRLARHPLLPYLKEWEPLLPMITAQSKVLLASFFAVLVTLRFTPKHFRAGEVALLALFGLSAWFTAPLVHWWLTLCLLLLLPHWQAIWCRTSLLNRPDGSGEPSYVTQSYVTQMSPARPLLLGASGIIALLLLLTSASGRWLLQGQPRPVEEQVSAGTPIQLAGHLNGWMQQDAGRHEAMPLRIFNSLGWGDYLLWDLPPSARIYWYSQTQGYTYRRLADAQHLKDLDAKPHDWRRLVERYRLNALILQTEPPSPLSEYVQKEARLPEWEIIYADAENNSADAARVRGIVAVRRIDPFVLALLNAQAVQGCMGPLGMTPLAGQWSFLTHLPWSWAEAGR